MVLPKLEIVSKANPYSLELLFFFYQWNNFKTSPVHISDSICYKIWSYSFFSLDCLHVRQTVSVCIVSIFVLFLRKPIVIRSVHIPPLCYLYLKSRTGNRGNKEGVSDCITFTDWNRSLCNQKSVGGVDNTPKDKRNDVKQNLRAADKRYML